MSWVEQCGEEVNHWAFKSKRFLNNPHGGAVATIMDKISHSSQNLYCIECQFCNLLYIGQSSQTLLNRLKQHLYRIGEGRLDTLLVQGFQIHLVQYPTITSLQTNRMWTEDQ